MRILAVDTTSAHSSVALVDDDEAKALAGSVSSRPRHAETLLPTVDDVLSRLETTLDEIDAFAVARGPGAFTGLRIGIAAVGGLSFATGRPAVGISTLEATAYRFRHVEGTLVSFLEAHRGEVYGAWYRCERGRLTPLSEPSCEPPERFLDRLDVEPTLVFGTGLLRYRPLVEARFPRAIVPESSFFLAEEVARLARGKLERGEVATSGSIGALYVRPSDAEREADSG